MCTGSFIHFWCPCLSHIYNRAAKRGHALAHTQEPQVYAWCETYLHSPNFTVVPPPLGRLPDCPADTPIRFEHHNFRSNTLCVECQQSGCIVVPGMWNVNNYSSYGHRDEEEKRAAVQTADPKSEKKLDDEGNDAKSIHKKNSFVQRAPEHTEEQMDKLMKSEVQQQSDLKEKRAEKIKALWGGSNRQRNCNRNHSHSETDFSNNSNSDIDSTSDGGYISTGSVKRNRMLRRSKSTKRPTSPDACTADFMASQSASESDSPNKPNTSRKTRRYRRERASTASSSSEDLPAKLASLSTREPACPNPTIPGRVADKAARRRRSRRSLWELYDNYGLPADLVAANSRRNEEFLHQPAQPMMNRRVSSGGIVTLPNGFQVRRVKAIDRRRRSNSVVKSASGGLVGASDETAAGGKGYGSA
ncbi:hypothetical protein N0V88_000746 [Collariella sp. IMI 366227]|nr:hypothetical protein N0V88_000746 [Collariella sp. IMI 366227]